MQELEHEIMILALKKENQADLRKNEWKESSIYSLLGFWSYNTHWLNVHSIFSLQPWWGQIFLNKLETSTLSLSFTAAGLQKKK